MRNERDSELLRIAKEIAFKAHSGQVDKNGHDYILHSIAVASRVRHYGPAYEAAALLHDTIEDSSITYDDLINAGIPAYIADAVALLSRSPGQSYKNFIMAIVESRNPIALEVKLADLDHNTDPGRGYVLPDSLASRYEKAKAILRKVK